MPDEVWPTLDIRHQGTGFRVQGVHIGIYIWIFWFRRSGPFSRIRSKLSGERILEWIRVKPLSMRRKSKGTLISV